ncbi:MAG: lytic transglycosylase domain-containing protein [Deltaproteobacteria bacterium]|nr:lytic transglycosylase domain-containing protein [Deltaproteobacteria bacterium]
MDESLITAVIINESGGKIEAVSDTGAYGVMQFTRDIYAPNPKKQFFKTSINPFVPEQAIDRGTAFLTYLRDLPYIKGDLEKIAAGYNQGEGAVADAVASAEAKGGNWKDYFWSTTKFNDPARRSEGLKFIASIKSILSLQDTRVSSAVHSLLANGPEIAQNNNVPSAKEWKQQHMDFNAEGSIVEIAPYAQKI